jgi:small-conductance mechanosensitive channel/CRP-like cAMP-binding protein
MDVFERVTADAIGTAIGLALLALALVALPPSAKRLARAPAVLLVLHLVARGIALGFDVGSGIEHDASLAALVLLLASIGRSSVLIALDGVLARRRTRPIPRIFRDIIQAVVYIALFFVALNRVGVEPGSLLATSALLTAASALALQETLGNLVAGLAIQAQRPFEIDDWIQFDADAKHVGRVIEINWRATTLVTLDDVEVIVPNGVLAKAAFVNFTKPTPLSRRSLYVQVPASVPPHDVRAAVLEALPGAFGVAETPAPTVVLNAFVDGNIEYWIRFHTTLFDKRDGVDSAARERVWYAFARRDIAIAAPGRAVRLREVTPESEAKREVTKAAHRGAILGKIDFLRALSDAQRDQLAGRSKLHTYGPGEVIVRQGEATSELFLVQSGEVVVQHEQDGRRTDLAELHEGEFFGEMALMTGEQRTATVCARTAAKLVSIDRDAMHELLAVAPELAAALSRAITERREAVLASSVTPVAPAVIEEHSTQLLDRIRKFFSL